MVAVTSVRITTREVAFARCVPVMVAATVVPRGPDFGVTNEIVGAGSVLESRTQTDGTGPRTLSIAKICEPFDVIPRSKFVGIASGNGGPRDQESDNGS